MKPFSTTLLATLFILGAPVAFAAPVTVVAVPPVPYSGMVQHPAAPPPTAPMQEDDEDITFEEAIANGFDAVRSPEPSAENTGANDSL